MIINGDTIQPSVGSNISVPNSLGINVGSTEVVEFNSTTGFLNQTPGSIIEGLWGVCDGSSHVLRSGTYTVQNVTAIQSLNNTYADITGSSISYTPPPQATKVVYRFAYANQWTPSSSSTHGISHHKFFIDGTEVIFARHNRSANMYLEYRTTFEWVIGIGGTSNTNTGNQNSWTSPKILKMQARDYSDGANEMLLHGTYYWDGSGGTQFSMPVINILAIR